MKYVIFIINGDLHILNLKFAKCMFSVLFVSVVSDYNLDRWTAGSSELGSQGDC